jgi:ElaB/YqjD/DUF883 family membrane-anchored ribosome-binding protein
MNHSDVERAERAAREERMDRRAREAKSGRLEMERLRQVGKNLGDQIDRQVRKRPYVIVGAAAGVGFVAGSILGSRLGQMLLAAGVGFLAKSALDGDFSPERVRSGLEKFVGSTDE